MSDCRKCADFEWCAKNEDCGLFKPKPVTKADRIRSMSDEELARFIARFEDLCVRHAGAMLADDMEELVKGRLEWLREEYKE